MREGKSLRLEQIKRRPAFSGRQQFEDQVEP
jgi:hypothetical protein